MLTISHRGRPVALAGRTRLWLAPHINALPRGHPRKRLVAFMALYARDILTGVLPGPYTDTDAERFARLALVDTDIIARHPHATDAQLAKLLRVPIEQLQAYLAELALHDESRPRPCGGRRRRQPPPRSRSGA